MAECVTELQAILPHLLVVVQEIKAKEWEKLVPEVLEITKEVWDVYECVKNNYKGLTIDSAILILQTPQDTKQCILDHLSAAGSDLKQAAVDLWHLNWDALNNDINDAITH